MDLYQKLEGGMGIGMSWSVQESHLFMTSFSHILCTASWQRSFFRRDNKEIGISSVLWFLGSSKDILRTVAVGSLLPLTVLMTSVITLAFELPIVTSPSYSYRYFPINSLFRPDRFGWNHCFDLSLLPYLG